MWTLNLLLQKVSFSVVLPWGWCWSSSLQSGLSPLLYSYNYWAWSFFIPYWCLSICSYTWTKSLFVLLPFLANSSKDSLVFNVSNSSPLIFSLASFVTARLQDGPQWFSPPGIHIFVQFLPQSPRVDLCKYSRSNCMIYVNTAAVIDCSFLRNLTREVSS